MSAIFQGLGMRQGTFVQSPGSKVETEVWLCSHYLAPLQEFVCPKLVGLDSIPGELRSCKVL